MSFLKKFKSKDFNKLLYSLSWTLPDWLFYYYHSYLITSNDPEIKTRTYTDYKIKFVTLEDLPILKKFGIKEELVKNRLKAGDRCVIISKNDEIQTIIWGASSSKFLKLGGYIFDPKDNGCTFYAGYSIPTARFKGLFPTAFKKLYQSYVDEGRNTIYAGVDSLNNLSLKIHLKMNFKIGGEIYYFIIFGISICYFKSWPTPRNKYHIFFKRPPKNLEWI